MGGKWDPYATSGGQMERGRAHPAVASFQGLRRAADDGWLGMVHAEDGRRDGRELLSVVGMPGWTWRVGGVAQGA